MVRANFAKFCISGALLHATSAHASGNLSVIYWMAGGVAVQIGCLAFFCFAPMPRRIRAAALAVYAPCLAALWGWIWHSNTSATLSGILLVVVPLLVVGVILRLTKHIATDAKLQER
jgi:hypothetical protein